MENDSLASFICQTTDNCNNSKWMVILIVVSTDENQFEQEATRILKNCILWYLNWFYQIKLDPFLFFCSPLLNHL